MYASEIIKVATAEIGYIEKATNSQLDDKTANAGSNNWTKYGRDLAKAGYYNGSKNGYAWCDQFVDWCFYQVAGKNKTLAEKIQCQTGPYGAGCGYSMQYYKDAGRFSTTPKVGDQIFFRYKGTTSGADHTGIVVEVTDKQITTIEGNSSNKVQKKTYSRTDSTIYGYGHPRYDAEPAPKPVQKTVKIELPVLRNGDNGTAVKTVQRILRQLEYIGADGELIKVDGDFGPNTEYAVKRFQFKRGSKTGDGIVGEWTWKMLLTAI